MIKSLNLIFFSLILLAVLGWVEKIIFLPYTSATLFKLLTKFSKFLSKFGFRLQYSVFEINNSDTVLQNITTEIENTYMKLFTEEDSIIIFKLSETCKKTCYGYAKNEDKEFFLIG